jgi:hypothetical protein
LKGGESRVMDLIVVNVDCDYYNHSDDNQANPN